MRIRVLVFLLLILAGHEVLGQNWAGQGARWTYDYADFFSRGIVQWTVAGDTLLQGQYCSLFRKDFEIKNCSLDVVNTGSFESIDIMYESSNVVYWYNSEIEIFDTLFWFDAVPGNTWTIQSPSQHGFDIVYLVLDTSTIAIGEARRRMLSVQYEINGSSLGSDDILIQGIGPTIGYMKPWDVLSGSVDGEHEGNSFLCYYDDQIGDYTVTEDGSCDLILATEMHDINTGIKIFPNPVRDELYIEGLENPTAPFYIFNSFGTSTKIKPSGKTISVENLSTGYYWLTLPGTQVYLPFVKVD